MSTASPFAVREAVPLVDELDGLERVDTGMSLDVVYVTPLAAAEWLERDRETRARLCTPNRPLNKRAVAHWAAEIIAGWKLTHQGIALDDRGCIADGQHRLTAIVETGKPIPLVVARGVPSKVFGVLDTGRPRTGADVLTMRRIPNATQVAACLRLLWLYDHVPAEAWKRSRVAPQRIAELLDEHPDIPATIKRVTAMQRAGVVITAAAVAVYVAGRAWPGGNAKLREFITGVGFGANLSRTDPRYRLRSVVANSGRKHRRRSAAEHLALCLKAWNLHASGREIANLAWRGDEPMPTPYQPAT